MPIFQANSATTMAGEISATQKSGSAFVQVSIDLMMREDISPAALKLYMFLLYYCGPKSSAWPSQNRLAERMHLTERRIRTLLGELVEAGLVIISHNTGTSNTYHLRKFQLKTADIGTEQNYQTERKDSSDHVHVLESITMCEKPLKEIEPPGSKKPFLTTVSDDSEQIQKLFQLTGMSPILCRELASKVLSFNRDISYVKQIIEASRSPKIANPIGFIRFMVLRNSVPLADKLPEPKAKKRQPGKTPLDFEKYTAGKYAYLLGEEQKVVIEAASEPGNSAQNSTSANLPGIVEENIAMAWVKAKALLRMTGSVPDKSLEHLKIKVTAPNNSVQIYYPGWLSLSQPQQKSVSEAITTVLGDSYTVTI